jgi:hypothetical protein
MKNILKNIRNHILKYHFPFGTSNFRHYEPLLLSTQIIKPLPFLLNKLGLFV